MKKSTIKDIAKYCEVGPSTVSRVLNNVTEGFSVKQEVREKILNAAKKLNYMPNPAAKNLKGQKSNLILLLGLQNWIFRAGSLYRQLILSAAEQLQQNSYQVHIALPPANCDESMLAHTAFDGALVIHGDTFPSLEDYLQKRRIPYVKVNKYSNYPNSSSVEYDDVAGVEKAMNNLLQLGHKKIAFGMKYKRDINVPEHISFKKRYETYARILEDNKLPFMQNDYFESSEDFLKEMFIKQKNTAVLAHEIRTAVEIYESAKKMKIRIPGDLSLICFNEVSDMNYPELDCMTVPGEKMGIAAADVLLSKIKDYNYTENVLVEGELLVGKTCSKPKKGIRNER